MEVGSKELLDFILEFNKYLTRTITIVAVGGTALTLLGKKGSTKDIDMCFPSEKDRDIFLKTAIMLGYKKELPNRLIGNGIVIDLYINGYIFSVQLPEDYLIKSVEIKKMERISLYSLSPEDIIITKTSRLNKRDEEDIITILTNYNIDQINLVARYIPVMENSLVRDAKDNLVALFSIIRNHVPINNQAWQNTEKWVKSK